MKDEMKATLVPARLRRVADLILVRRFLLVRVTKAEHDHH